MFSDKIKVPFRTFDGHIFTNSVYYFLEEEIKILENALREHGLNSYKIKKTRIVSYNLWNIVLTFKNPADEAYYLLLIS